MNRKYNILSGALLLLVSGACLQSCQNEEWAGLQPNRETLIAEGRYLATRSEDASESASDTEEPKLFEVGTPYRLLAFSKPYDATDYDNQVNNVNHPRFNKVAWEGETADGLRYINIDSEPDKWFGFQALSGETGGDDGLVSLDFYGFTYGVNADHNADYIPIDGWQTGGDTKLDELKHTESLNNGELKDLMRGELPNQNIWTAGKSKDGDNWTDNAYTQSVIPFRHCFSKLRFQVSQQYTENADGSKSPSFENLCVESIQVTGTYGSGDVYLHDGKIDLKGNICSRNLPFVTGYDGRVPENNTDVGNMIIFPSDGSDLKNEDLPDGYDIGLEITVKSTVEKDIINMVRNTGGDVSKITSETKDGTTWFKGTISKESIIDYLNAAEGQEEKQKVLHFKQNTSYMLIIVFQKDAVRIITVIPQIEEWLPGEGDATDPWQEQALGQPQMFDNIIWSDRNLGADHYDPINAEFENSIGYFYQAGRNIPYYPFKHSDYVHGSVENHPTIDDMHNLQNYGDNDTRWSKSGYRFYPVVDDRILSIGSPKWWVITKKEAAIKDGTAKEPQMIIPETRPTDRYFDFMVDKTLGDNDVKWNEGPQNQPVSGAWNIPTSDQFMSIFPSTPHAGNIAFKTGGYNNDPMNWGSDDSQPAPYLMDSSVKTLRVTVPYYNPNETSKKNDSGYLKAWNTLKKHNDPGTTHSELYTVAGPDDNIYNDPNGDPEDGYASVYVISKEEGSIEYLPEHYANSKSDNKDNFWVKEWGTIYSIKRVYTSQAYRMRWRALIAAEGKNNPGYVIEICRYRCTENDTLDETNYKDYDWDHPAARIYFPVCGLGDHPGFYINYGVECQYATSDPIINGKTSAVQIKINGNNTANAYISIVKKVVDRHFGMQIRPVLGR